MFPYPGASAGLTPLSRNGPFAPTDTSNCPAKGWNCPPANSMARMDTLECPADISMCRSDTIECRSDTIECQSDTIECRSDTIECRLGSLECRSDSLECRSDSLECPSDTSTMSSPVICEAGSRAASGANASLSLSLSECLKEKFMSAEVIFPGSHVEGAKSLLAEIRALYAKVPRLATEGPKEAQKLAFSASVPDVFIESAGASIDSSKRLETTAATDAATLRDSLD